MSARDELDKSPNHFIVLDAISRGISSIDKISKASKMDKLEVELITNDLLTQRLIAKTERRGLIFRKKKQELGITDIGMKLLNAKKQELEQKRQQMQQSYNNRDGTQLQSYMDANRIWMPMMLFSGIMDIMFFTSMMSYIGLGINPLENAIMGVQSSGGGSLEQTANSSNDADHHSSNDEHGTSGETDGTGEGADYDNSSFDSGGFDGFDGGGFDSF
ncbi:MAG TPA: MarR family transcriptional regulator [Nitrososphaeraceae archaeon]|nr:MarR family transcriptional regulator [Nitrososphaeraceae archaeon]